MKALKIKKNGCVGCQACEMVCSAAHGGGFNPRYARIKLAARLPLPKSPTACIHCAKAHCIEACPTDSLSREGRGVLQLNKDTCTGCGLCVEACPYHGLFFDKRANLPLYCDLCGGKPKCVEICPMDIISW